MSIRLWSWLVAIVVAVAVMVAIGAAWRAEIRDRAQLENELAANKQALQAADARQQERDAKLAVTLEQIAAERRTVQSPAQIAEKLPAIMQLPVAIALRDAGQARPVAAESGNGNIRISLPNTPAAKVSGAAGSTAEDPGGEAAVVPGQDLKPMYDFALGCKACQAQLTAVQSDLADERLKSNALTQERDDALRVARGGSVLRRMGTACKWMLIGAAAGAVAARVAH